MSEKADAARATDGRTAARAVNLLAAAENFGHHDHQ
jgi:hypothetical protein